MHCYLIGFYYCIVLLSGCCFAGDRFVVAGLLIGSVFGIGVVLVMAGLLIVCGLCVDHSCRCEFDIVVVLLLACSACFAWRASLHGVLPQRLCGFFFVVVVAVFVPIVVDGFVLRVEIAVCGVVVIGNDVDVVVDAGQVLMLPQLVGVFHHLELIWLKEVLMLALGRLLVVSSVGVLAVV